jgi:uncharacterized protein YbaP (TraB family)
MRPTCRWPAIAAGLLLCVFAAMPASAAPAWWRISDGHAEVWVLGAPRVTPKGMVWDEAGVTLRLTGASQLIVPPQPRDGLKAMAVLISGAGSPTPLHAALDPALRGRFDAVSAAIGKDPKAYDHWKPAVAGVMLAGDFFKANDLKPNEVESAVRKLARKLGVTEAPAGSFDAAEMAGAAEALGPAAQAVCLTGTLAGIEAGPAPLRAIAADWARGDPRAAPQTAADLACLAAMPAMKSLNARNLDAEARAVAVALAEPGRSVAVFDLQQLTMPGGVFERLRAQGLTVSGPLP